jgi:hypothetical protein
MNGFSLLSDMGGYMARNPTETAAVGIAGAAGLSLMGSAIANPMDTTMNAMAAAGEPGAWGIGAVGLGLAGLGVASAYGAETLVKNRGAIGAGTAAGRAAASFGKGLNRVAGWGGAAASGMNPGRVLGGAVKAYGAMWDSSTVRAMGGWKFMAGGTMLAGAGFGLVKAGFNMATSAPVYDSAMARAEEGSAYEGGPGAFGAGSGVRALGQSTMGLVGGLHNQR